MRHNLMSMLWLHRSLVVELTKREFSSKYRGSFGGVFWALAQPFFLLGIYTVAFGTILQARWENTGSTAEYALMLFAGLVVFNAFSEVLSKSPRLIADNPNFVKKVVFPLELLAVVTVIHAYFHACIGIAVWLVAYLVIVGAPQPTVVFFPLVLLCFFPFLLGLSWLLSAIGVAVKDIGQITALLGHGLLFLTPIFYSADAAPALLKNLLLLNPLSFVVEQFRWVMFIGRMPSFEGLAIYLGLASLFSWLALSVFRRLRSTFADLV